MGKIIYFDLGVDCTIKFWEGILTNWRWGVMSIWPAGQASHELCIAGSRDFGGMFYSKKELIRFNCFLLCFAAFLHACQRFVQTRQQLVLRLAFFLTKTTGDSPCSISK